MKKSKIGKSLLLLFLTVALVFPMGTIDVFAEVGTFSNVSTGLTSDGIDTEEKTSLPIKIYDYESDGMLFEYAESYEEMTAADFGSEFFQIVDTVGDIANTSTDGAFDDTTVSLAGTDNNYVDYVRLTYKGKTSNNWLSNNSGIWISTYCQKDEDDNWIGVIGSDLEDINDIRYVTVVYRSNVSSDNMYFAFGDNATEANTSGRYTGALPFTSAGDDGRGSSQKWTYKVYDLKTGTLANNWGSNHPLISDNPARVYIGLPLDASGEWIDLAHVAFFSNADMAQKFGEYSLTDGSNRGDNRGFGLLRGSRNEGNNGTVTNGYGSAFKGVFNYSDANNTIYQANTYSHTEVTNATTGATTSINPQYIDYTTVKDKIGYNLYGIFKDNGIANVGLLESSLSPEGYPVYKKEVVTYVAQLLEHSLAIKPETNDGWIEYRFVQGAKNPLYGKDENGNYMDLATVLRKQITEGLGTYEQSAAKKLVGTWEECGESIKTYYDAAYFMLNSIFVGGSYNEVKTDYNYLELSKASAYVSKYDEGTDTYVQSTDTETTYVFDAGFSTTTKEVTVPEGSMAIDYNTTTKTIANTAAVGKAHFAYEDSNTTTLNPFLPIRDRNNSEGQTVSPYWQDDAVLNESLIKDTYKNRNFNFAMVGAGDFVYHADDELFFEFEGDDDVYLFINGELVMDIGSAHSIDSVKFYLNDYVNAAKEAVKNGTATERDKKLALLEDNSYHLKFFYLERHGYGSNIRISTNIKITDPKMETAKTGYQGELISYGSIVNKDQPVEYGFSITNKGNAKLYNIAFDDPAIGIKMTPTEGLVVSNPQVCDVNGNTLEVTDLYAIATGIIPENQPNAGEVSSVKITFANDKEFKNFLYNMSSDGVVDDGGGLWVGSTLQIRGFAYKLTTDQIKAGVFDNTVYSSAWDTVSTTGENAGVYLTGQASMRVFVPADPMYYQWAGKALEVQRDQLIDAVLAAANQTGNILEGKVPGLTKNNVTDISFCTSNGNEIVYDRVTYNNNKFTINYSEPSSYMFYVKITYSASQKPVVVPVLVNVTDVEDSVYVIDYGLSVNLTDKVIDSKKDYVTVPGRATVYALEGATNEEPSYKPNNISFVKAESIVCADGEYVWNQQNGLTYSPKDFMDGADLVYTAVRVKEEDFKTENPIGTVDINNEVEMYKKLTTIPASVVYYEDDFPAIKYLDSAGEIIADVSCKNLGINGIEQTKPDVDFEQSNDQNEAYGHERVYEVASDLSSSAGKITTIAIKNTNQIVEFTFTGTGFELVSRTDAKTSGSIMLELYNSSGDRIRRIPVITEFDHNAETPDDKNEVIYQVPIIRVNDLTKDTYTVKIKGSPLYDYSNWDGDLNNFNREERLLDSNLYVDGIRIFQPLGAENDNYTSAENNAVYDEIRDLIVEGTVGVVSYNEESGLTLSTETSTWTENRIGYPEVADKGTEDPEDDAVNTDFTRNEVNNVNDYLIYGPNNEVYLNADSSKEALVFNVKRASINSKATTDTTIPTDSLRSLQIAVRGIDAGLFMGDVAKRINAPIKYYTAEGTWEPIHTLTSWTEQYYKIDFTKCPYDEATDSYQVIIVLDTGMASFSTLKYTGLLLSDLLPEDKKNSILAKYSDVMSGEEPEDTTTDEIPEETPNYESAANGTGIDELLDEYLQADSTYTLNSDSRIYVISDEEPSGEILQTVQLAARQFADEGYPSNSTMKIVWGNESFIEEGDIVVKFVEESKRAYTEIGEEGYQIEVSDTAVVTVKSADGLLYGLNTLLKHFMYYESNTLPVFSAVDNPDTEERTVMLDCARKYYTPEWIKNFIREMSWMGYNTLELHIADDGGFRVDVWDSDYFTSADGNDFSWLCGGDSAYWVQASYSGSGKYAEKSENMVKYLTATDLISIFDVAREYHIDVIPSLDTPGHSEYMNTKYYNYVRNNSKFSFSYDGVKYSNAGITVNGVTTSYASAFPNTNANFGKINFGSNVPDNSAKDDAIDCANPVARAFAQAVIRDIGDFFKKYAGSTEYNIGTDEVLFANPTYGVNWATYAQKVLKISNGTAYDTFIHYINETAAMLQEKGYKVRAFNDCIYRTSIDGTSISAKEKLDPSIEIVYWTDKHVVDGTQTYDAADFEGEFEKIYNAMADYNYYVLRCKFQYTNGKYVEVEGGDALNPNAPAGWEFNYATAENNYNEWNPTRMYAPTKTQPNVQSVDGGYYLVWCDFAGYKTEKQVWEGVTYSSGTYNIIERMWANSTKMWNWDVNSNLNYANFKAIHSKYTFYPGFDDYEGSCSVAPIIRETRKPERAAEVLLAEIITQGKINNSKGLYTEESYVVYSEAYDAVLALSNKTDPRESEILAAVDNLNKATESLKKAAMKLTVEYVTESNDTVKETEVYDIDETGKVKVYLEGVVGYLFIGVEDFEGGKITYEPLKSGSTTCGYLVGSISNSTTVTVVFKSEPYVLYLDELLRTAISSNGDGTTYKVYTEDSWNNYVNAKNTAAAARDDIISAEPEKKWTQQEIDAVVDTYLLAKDALVSIDTEVQGVELVTKNVQVGETVELKVTTSIDVKEITVDGVEVTCNGVITDGIKEWNVIFTAKEVGEFTYTIFAKGNTSETTTIDVTVEDASSGEETIEEIDESNKEIPQNVSEEPIDEPTLEDVVEDLTAA